MHKDTDLEHQNRAGLTALMVAAKEGHTAMVAHLLSAAASTLFWHFGILGGPFLTGPRPSSQHAPCTSSAL